MKLICIFVVFVNSIYATKNFTETKPSLRCTSPLMGWIDEPSERGFIFMEEKEIWKDVVDFEGLYLVSNLGGICRCRNGKLRLLKAWINAYGYVSVKLYKRTAPKTFIKKTTPLHRIMAIAFLPNESNKPEVNHIDGNKKNNTLSNLEWNTSKENVTHAISNGLRDTKGEKQRCAILTENEVIEIRKSKLGYRRLAKIYTHVSLSAITSAKQGRTWKHLPSREELNNQTL